MLLDKIIVKKGDEVISLVRRKVGGYVRVEESEACFAIGWSVRTEVEHRRTKASTTRQARRPLF